MILKPEKVAALVPIENPARPRFVIETTYAQGMTRSRRYYMLEELTRGGKKKDQSNRPISEIEAKEFWRKMQPKDNSTVKHIQKTLAQIFVWTLLVTSQVHSQSLIKDLDDVCAYGNKTQ